MEKPFAPLDMESFKKLAGAITTAVNATVKKDARLRNHQDDLSSVAVEALVRYLESTGNDTRSIASAVGYCRWRIVDWLRQTKPLGYGRSRLLNPVKMIQCDDEFDIPCPPESPIRDMMEEWGELFTGVSREERRMVDLRLMGFNAKDIAEQMGIDASTISHRIRRFAGMMAEYHNDPAVKERIALAFRFEARTKRSINRRKRAAKR